MTAPQPGQDPSLEAMVQRIQEARRVVSRTRNGRVARDELSDARHELMLALQAYAAALERRNLPVPWRMHAELRLHRGLFGR